jgi:hypothetical protein
MKMQYSIGKKGDVMGYAIAAIGVIVAISIGYLVLLQTKTTMGGLSGLTSEDNVSVQAFMGNMTNLYTLFAIVVLVLIAGIVIWVLRTFGGSPGA